MKKYHAVLSLYLFREFGLLNKVFISSCVFASISWLISVVLLSIYNGGVAASNQVIDCYDHGFCNWLRLS